MKPILPVALVAVAVAAGAIMWVSTSSTPAATESAPVPGASSMTPLVVRYEITGMHCDGCAAAIVAEVLEVPGVSSAVCTYESKQAEIHMNNSATRAAVEHAITKLGYTLAPATDAARPGAQAALTQGAAATGAPPAVGTPLPGTAATPPQPPVGTPVESEPSK